MSQFPSLVPSPSPRFGGRLGTRLTVSPPVLCSSVLFSIIHESGRAVKNGGMPGNTYHVTWTWGKEHNYKLVYNKPQSKFLTSGIEYCWSHERLGSWLLLECSMMKSNTLLKRGPLPPYIHLMSTRCHSQNRCSHAFSVLFCFCCSFTVMYYAECKPKNIKQRRSGNEANSSPPTACKCAILPKWAK